MYIDNTDNSDGQKNVTIVNSAFVGCSAGANGNGGVAYIKLSADERFLIKNTHFHDNEAKEGNNIYFECAAASNVEKSRFKIDNCYLQMKSFWLKVNDADNAKVVNKDLVQYWIDKEKQEQDDAAEASKYLTTGDFYSEDQTLKEIEVKLMKQTLTFAKTDKSL